MALKNTLHFLFFILLSATGLNAQNVITDTSITTITYWKKGEGRILQISQKKEKYQGGILKVAGGSTYQAKIKVLSESATGYTVEWTYMNINTNAGTDAIAELVYKLNEGIKVVYEIDEVGMFVQVKNWKEVRKDFNSSLDLLVSKGGGNPQEDAVLKMIKGVYQSQEAVEQLLVKDIQLYHGAFGFEFVLNEENTTETVLPNVLGGDPFPALMTVKLEDIDQEKNYGKLTMKQTIDKEKGSAIVYEFVRKLSEAAGKQISEDEEMPLFDIVDNNVYEFELEMGWISRAFHERIVENNELKQVESLEIVMVK